MVFATLFDSNYLDKGLVLYRSLMKACPEVRFYVLAMDEKCYEILSDLGYSYIHLIRLTDFINYFHLEEVYKTRSRGEFCWTCSSFLIDYVLEKNGEDICTYIDADLCFYSDPQCLIDEMGEKTVQIVEHRFSHSIHGKVSQMDSGKYCVQFNTFKNTPDALALLHWWMGQCASSCSNDSGNGVIFGDQGYLENWAEKPIVSVLQNLGGGVAPWNVAQYQLVSHEKEILLKEKKTAKVFPLVFYHFHYIQYIDDSTADIHVYEPWRADRKLINLLYSDYLRKLDQAKDELREKYGIYPLLKAHPGYKASNDTGRDDKKDSANAEKNQRNPFVYRLIDEKIGQRIRNHYHYLNKYQFRR